jgi:catechol 2,3-dioxygenase-like lactoylglutathione lyase family enzyme
VADLGRSVRFFVETLGMKLVAEREGGAEIDAGDGFVLALVAGTGVRGSGAVRIGLGAKLPLDEAVAILENRGVLVTRAGGVASFHDPDGHTFFLYPAHDPA